MAAGLIPLDKVAYWRNTMNDLEKALLDETNVGIDFYLDAVSTKDFRRDVEQLVKESICSTPMGKLKANMLKVLNEA